MKSSGHSSFTQRRRAQAGQSAIIAVIVLFLLLFLGAAFIAIIANNLRNTQRAATTSASGRFAEAGIRYLDEQLTGSPQGADWRPAPDNSANPQDPDYFWLQPYKFDIGRSQYVGGYTRINFGGPTPTSTNSGGRALVRVSYRPDIYQQNGQPATTQQDPNYVPDPSHKYIRLEAVGRSGQVNPQDPTTFGNSDGFGQRVELSAYKQIGINEYARQITNKDNKPDDFNLGAVSPVQDYDGKGNLITRDIETLIDGPVRVNGNLTFYGVNRLVLDPARNDALEVAGRIALNGVPATVGMNGLTTTDPTRVYVNVLNANTTTAPNLYPSGSTAFSTSYPVAGVVRDNPRGGETLQISNTGDPGNSNLRAVSRSQPPLIDAPIGPNGLTRYLALTRDSAPLSTNDTADNPIDPSLTVASQAGSSAAGADGWGTGMYINNPQDSQASSDLFSPRSEWLNPSNVGKSAWKSDSNYTPPAVDIVLTPRYMVMTSTDSSQGSYLYFRTPAATFKSKAGAGTTTNSGLTAGQRMTEHTIVRYTGATPPTDPAIPDGTPEFQGYPATAVPGQANTFAGDYVIYAEGNVRIRGLVGGSDGTNHYIRHLTVVSNGIIYIDGNLLRDNFAATDPAHNQSSIALLAKNYITVNTTQFLAPDVALYQSEAGQNGTTPPFSVLLNSAPGTNRFGIHPNFGPEDRNNTSPAYLSGKGSPAPTPPTVNYFFRHGAAAPSGAGSAAIALAVDPDPANPTPSFYNFGPAGDPIDPLTLLLTSVAPPAGYNDDVFSSTVGQTTSLLPTVIGVDNLLQVQYQTGQNSNQNYLQTRFGVAPLDIRIEALMYAQEGSFFIIPGPSFNPDPNDNLINYYGNPNLPSQKGHRAGEPTNPTSGTQNLTRTNDYFPFYGQPMDIRITFYGSISENVPAEIGDQGAWLEKWGWVPTFFGSSGFSGVTGYTTTTTPIKSAHGPAGYLYYPKDEDARLYSNTNTTADGTTGGSGILYQFDDRAISPYYESSGNGNGPYLPLRNDLTRVLNFGSGNPPIYAPLPIVPNLPVAPGLLYFGQDTNVPR